MKTTTKIALISVALPFAASLGYAAPAADNWENECASCHGADGKGQTKQGKKLKVRDYTDAAVQAEMKDDVLLKAIIEGVKENGKERMKAFKEILTEEESKELVAYIRKLKA